jgi:hypothetical protein
MVCGVYCYEVIPSCSGRTYTLVAVVIYATMLTPTFMYGCLNPSYILQIVIYRFKKKEAYLYLT